MAEKKKKKILKKQGRMIDLTYRYDWIWLMSRDDVATMWRLPSQVFDHCLHVYIPIMQIHIWLHFSHIQFNNKRPHPPPSHPVPPPFRFVHNSSLSHISHPLWWVVVLPSRAHPPSFEPSSFSVLHSSLASFLISLLVSLPLSHQKALWLIFPRSSQK